MSDVLSLEPAARSDRNESAGFMAVSLGLHILVAILLILGLQPYGTKTGSREVALTEVSLAEPQTVQQPAPAAPPVTPAPPVEKAVEPAVAEAQPEPVPEPVKAEEPKPEEPPVPPAIPETTPADVADNNAVQQDAGGAPMPMGGQTLFCTHPPVSQSDLETYYATRGYGVLGTPPGYGRDDGEGGHVMLFGQDGGPKIIRFIMPEYPYNARVQNLEGVVILGIRLDEAGAVQGVYVMQSGGNEFDAAALDAARRSQFGPAVIDGRPVACTAALPVRFTLK